MVYTACNYRLKYDKIIMNIELRIEVKELSTYIRFLYDLFEQFFSGIINIFMGFFNGIIKMFNFKAYLKILKEYSGEFSVGQWILVGLAVLLILAFLLGIIYLIKEPKKMDAPKNNEQIKVITKAEVNGILILFVP